MTTMVQAPYQQKSTPTLAQAPASQEDTARQQKMGEAWKAYRGELARPLKVKAGKPDCNVMVNRCAPVVDKGVSFLFGKVMKIEDQGGDTSPVQKFLDTVWGDDDDRMTLLSNAAINGGICGQVFLRLIPAQGMMKYPRIIVMNPQIVRIVTAPDDCSLTLAYIIEYPAVSGDVQKRQVIARVDPDGLAGVAGEYDLDDTWTITNYMRVGPTGAWYRTGPVTPWLWPFAPIFTCQNLPNPNEVWGKPDLTQDLIDQNKNLNFTQSNMAAILYNHAHPKTYAIGMSATQINIGIDDLICLPSPDSKLANLEMQSDLHSSLNFSATLRDDMDEQSRVPAVALGRLEAVPKGNVSGVALQLLFQPLIEKTVQKQRLYGRLIRDTSRAALILSGLLQVEDYESYEIGLHWQNLLPVDDLAAAQTALVLEQLGVSEETILQQLGFDPEDEAKKVAVATAKKVAALPPAMAAQTGQPPPNNQQPNNQQPMNTQQAA